SVVSIRMPPLRERGSDAVLIAEEILRQITNQPGAALSTELCTEITGRRWPGNVRELRNFVERTATLGTDGPADPAQIEGDGAGPNHSPEVDPTVPFKEAKQRVIACFERPYLEQLMQRSKGNLAAAARQAQIDRVYLLKLLRTYGLR